MQEDFDNSPGGLELGADLGGCMNNAESSAELAEQQALVAHLQQENDALQVVLLQFGGRLIRFCVFQASITELEEKVSTSKLQEDNNQSTELKLQEAAAQVNLSSVRCSFIIDVTLVCQHSEVQRENVRLTEQLENSQQEVNRVKDSYAKAVQVRTYPCRLGCSIVGQVCQSLKNRLQESISQSGDVGAEKLAEVQQSLDEAEKRAQEAEERAFQAEAALQVCSNALELDPECCLDAQSKASDMRALEQDLKCTTDESEGLKQRLSEVAAQAEMQARRLANDEVSANTGSA